MKSFSIFITLFILIFITTLITGQTVFQGKYPLPGDTAESKTIVPDSDSVRNIGEQTNRYLNGYFWGVMTDTIYSDYYDQLRTQALIEESLNIYWDSTVINDTLANYAIKDSVDYHYNHILTVGSRGAMFTSISDAIDSINTAGLDSVKIEIKDAYFVETNQVILPDVSFLIIDGENNKFYSSQDTIFKCRHVPSNTNNYYIQNFKIDSLRNMFMYLGSTNSNITMNNIVAEDFKADYLLYCDSLNNIYMNNINLRNKEDKTSRYGINIEEGAVSGTDNIVHINNYYDTNMESEESIFNQISNSDYVIINNIHGEDIQYIFLDVDSCGQLNIYSSNLRNTFEGNSEINIINSNISIRAGTTDTITMAKFSTISNLKYINNLYESHISTSIDYPYIQNSYNNIIDVGLSDSIYSDIITFSNITKTETGNLKFKNGYINHSTIDMQGSSDILFLPDSINNSIISGPDAIINNGYINKCKISQTDSISSTSEGKILNSSIGETSVQNQYIYNSTLKLNAFGSNNSNIFNTIISSSNNFYPISNSWIENCHIISRLGVEFNNFNTIMYSKIYASVPTNYGRGTVNIDGNSDSCYIYNSEIIADSSGCPIMVRNNGYLEIYNSKATAMEGAKFVIDGGATLSNVINTKIISKGNTYVNNSNDGSQAAIMLDYGLQMYSYNDKIYSKSGAGVKTWRSSSDRGAGADTVSSYIEMYNGEIYCDSSYALMLLTNNAKIYDSKLVTKGLADKYTVRISSADDGDLTWANDTVIIDNCDIITKSSAASSYNIAYIQYSDTNAINKYIELKDNRFYNKNGYPIAFATADAQDSIHLTMNDRNIFNTQTLIDTTLATHVGSRFTYETTAGYLIPNLDAWSIDLYGDITGNGDSRMTGFDYISADTVEILGTFFKFRHGTDSIYFDENANMFTTGNLTLEDSLFVPYISITDSIHATVGIFDSLYSPIGVIDSLISHVVQTDSLNSTGDVVCSTMVVNKNINLKELADSIVWKTDTDDTLFLVNDANALTIYSSDGGSSGFRLLPYNNDIYFQSKQNSSNHYFTGNGGQNLTGNFIFKGTSYLLPDADNVLQLGKADTRWENMHTMDAHVYDDLTVDGYGSFGDGLSINDILFTSNDSLFGDTNSVWDLSNISTIIFPDGDYQFDVIKSTQTDTFGYVGTAAYPYQRAWIDTITAGHILSGNDTITFTDQFLTELISVETDSLIASIINIDSLYSSGGIYGAGSATFDGIITANDTVYTSNVPGGLVTGFYDLGQYAYDYANGTGFDFYIDPGDNMPYLMLYGPTAWNTGALLSPDTFAFTDGTKYIAYGSGKLSVSDDITTDSVITDIIHAANGDRFYHDGTDWRTSDGLDVLGQLSVYNAGSYIAGFRTVTIKNLANTPLEIDLTVSGYNDSVVGIISGKTDNIGEIDTLDNFHWKGDFIVDGYGSFGDSVEMDSKLILNDAQAIETPFISAGVADSVVAAGASTWYVLKFDSSKVNTNTDYFQFAPNNDSTKILIKQNGYVKVTYFLPWYSNGVNANTEVAGVIYKNNVMFNKSGEVETRDFANTDIEQLVRTKKVNVSVNDTIEIGYYTTDVDVYLKSAGIFTYNQYGGSVEIEWVY